MSTISARMRGRDGDKPPCVAAAGMGRTKLHVWSLRWHEEYDRHPLSHVSRQTLYLALHITPALSISLRFGITHKLTDGLGHTEVSSSQF